MIHKNDMEYNQEADVCMLHNHEQPKYIYKVLVKSIIFLSFFAISSIAVALTINSVSRSFNSENENN